MPVFREKPGGFDIVTSPLKYNLTYCSGSLFGHIDPRALGDWIQYHHGVVGVEKFFFYDHGGLTVDNDTAAVVAPYEETGVVTVTRMKGGRHFVSYYSHQIMNQNDCLYRSRFLTRWLLYTDLDEYIFTPPPATFLSWLDGLPSNASWASMGSYMHSINTCSQPHHGNATNESQLLVEHLPWRAELPSCPDRAKALVCPGAHGRRKQVVDPRRVNMVSVHRVEDPWDLYGVDWNASFAEPLPKLMHFQGLPVRKPVNVRCRDVKEGPLKEGEVVEDGKIEAPVEQTIKSLEVTDSGAGRRQHGSGASEPEEPAGWTGARSRLLSQLVRSGGDGKEGGGGLDQSTPPMSFVVHFGDIVDGFCPTDRSEEAVNTALDAMAGFTAGPTYHMFGNHCLYNLPRVTLRCSPSPLLLTTAPTMTSRPFLTSGQQYWIYSASPPLVRPTALKSMSQGSNEAVAALLVAAKQGGQPIKRCCFSAPTVPR
ncbi:unnamed protein product [Closterium sp. Yama58-4]|nr:unnamed protein product [Closterium sp. Yama58-4]